MKAFDVVVIGAGAAGLYCAWMLGQRGQRVLVLDHARRVGEKIRISGGGRCNFTNLNGADECRYVSGDTRFMRYALRAHPPARFIEQVRAARIRYHEKHKGQLFCDESSQRIIDMLLAGCKAGGVQIRHPVTVCDVRRETRGFVVGAQQTGGRPAEFVARSLVVATGGLSIPAIGATDYAWRLAARWGIDTVPPRPGLVPLTFTAAGWEPFRELSGVALPVSIGLGSGMKETLVPQDRMIANANANANHRVDGGKKSAALKRDGVGGRGSVRAPVFEEDLLFTHRGLSGPAALQISSHWQPGQGLVIDLLPGLSAEAVLLDLKAGSWPGDLSDEMVQKLGAQPHRQRLGNILAALLPARLARIWLSAAVPMLPVRFGGLGQLSDRMRLAEVADGQLRLLARSLKAWPVLPAGSEGYRKAEVSVGGVATRELDPRTMQSRRVPGSYWIGEAVDVTGWLGGYNFQWAWSSAHAAATAISARAPG
ncbi:MAG: NAD(P)/FAD-dependent oxidoreductase [Lautropia sp.]|nr:NAD(P)/FAD-dependent oxidoreductase [Lautropia sp.]